MQFDEREAAIGRLFYGWRWMGKSNVKSGSKQKRVGKRAGGASASAGPGAWLEM